MSRDPELTEEFVTQSLEHLEDAEVLLLDMEKTGAASSEATNEVFRAVHSIKGAAGFLGLENVQALSHAMESLLMRVRDGDLAFSARMAGPLLDGVGHLRRMLASLPHSEGEPAAEVIQALEAEMSAVAPTAEPDPIAHACDAQRRRGHHLLVVPLPGRKRDRERLLRRIERFGELVRTDFPAPREALVGTPLEADLLAEALSLPLERVRIYASGLAVEGEHTDAPAWAGSADSGRGETVRVSVAVLDKLMNLAGELVLGRNQLRPLLGRAPSRQLKTVFQQLDLVTTELQENIVSTRMQPIGVLFDRLPRLARDLAQKLGRSVELRTEGGRVELDRSILEALADPLSHLLRNAIDHGVEDPSDRSAAGKSETARICVRAFHERGRVVIEIEDDGRGIDPAGLVQAALERGLLNVADAAALEDRERLALLFRPGLSTASQVTELSGRGVGMDVVRNNIERVGGQVEIKTRLGEGSMFHIHLPLTLAIIPSLVVSVGRDRFAIPQVNLVEVVRLHDGAQQLEDICGTEVLRLRGDLLPLARLRRCLAIEEPGTDASVLVLRCGAHEFGLVVDEIHDSEEIVVKPLPSFFADCGWYAGATILGDGGVAMILDATGISRRAGLRFDEVSDEADRRRGPVVDEAQGQKRSLVVFANGSDERFAVPLESLHRLEHATGDAVERIGERAFLRHQGRAIPLMWLDDVLPVAPSERGTDGFFVLIPRSAGSGIGIVACQIIDTIESNVELEATHLHGPGLLGSAVVDGRFTLFLDPVQLVEGFEGRAI